MTTDVPGPLQPTFRPLQRARALSTAERRLLDRLAAAAGHGAADALAVQIAGAEVVGVCACGCSSVQLTTTGAPLPVPVRLRLSGRGRSEHVGLSAWGRSRAGHRVDVEPHLVQGRLHELEVFDTEAGLGTAVDPATLTRLSRPVVD